MPIGTEQRDHWPLGPDMSFKKFSPKDWLMVHHVLVRTRPLNILGVTLDMQLSTRLQQS